VDFLQSMVVYLWTWCVLLKWLYHIPLHISFDTSTHDTPLELGDVANIKKSRRNTTPIPRLPAFLVVVHCEISYGDSKAVGGARFCLMLVDWATRYCWIYALKSLCHENIKKGF